MSKEIALQRRLMANWLVLCVNMLLLAFLVFTWLNRLRPLPTVIEKDKQISGMDVYCYRSPFAVFVNKDFPDNKGFMFARYGRLPLFVSCEDVKKPSQAPPNGDHGEAQTAQNITLGFGDKGYFTVSCLYSIANNRVHVDELLVSRDDAGRVEAYFDLNADGFPDSRLTVDHKRDVHRSEIWYGGKWQEAAAQGSKYETQLLNGEKVRFDKQGGLWVLAGDEKNGGHKEGSEEAEASKK